jgi:hypothetical protein
MGAMVGLHGVADAAPLVFSVARAVHGSLGRGVLSPGGWLSAQYRPPFEVERRQWSTIALRLLPSTDIYQRHPWSAGIALGGGIDLYRVDNGSEEGPMSRTEFDGDETVPVLSALCVMRLRVAQNLHLVSFAGLDFDLSHPDVESSRDRGGSLRTWVVHPTLMLGLTWAPFGTEPPQ